ncbi:hypothetical protein [Streptomyces viridochromogenes]|uniref:Uncharacterized protein n=1 Tax=Streptomyces viridochromogenes Tue57 TaxID=1160705 RepID=L8PU82_STRVR|nr:hypothetical protein [Streptomyces viridochromogenes]ELS58967.1 hypothetical protein STVIR_0099 [Streptomyces viridochromogenes Tue57]
MPSAEEITRVRRLVRRLREDLHELTDDDRCASERKSTGRVRRCTGAATQDTFN